MYLMGVDIGSSSEKLAVFDYDGNAVAIAKYEYPIRTEHEGYAEQDPDDYYRAFLHNLERIDASVLSQVTAVCICGQTPTDIFVDEQGKPLCPAIMWRDTRAKAQFERQKTRYSFAELEKMSGCPIPKSENWTTLRMAWLKDEAPQLAQKVYKVLQPKDYLIYKLSQSFVTDLWSARCFANVQTGKINAELLDFFGYGTDVAPQIYAPTAICASVYDEQAEKRGLRRGLPIVCGCGDGFAAMLSSGLFAAPSIAFNSTGTSEMAGCCTAEERSRDGLYTFPRALTGERAVLFGPTQSGGSSLIWFAENVLHISFEEMIEKASRSTAGSNGLVFLPYICGERAPIWDANAKGCFFGIKQSHTDCDFARSVLEGVAFSIRSLLEASGERVDVLRLLGGGSKLPLWCQIRADVLQAAVETVDCAEACAQGAAIIAGVGVGAYSSYHDAALKTCKVSKRYTPNAGNAAIYERNYKVYKSLYTATKDLMKEL